MEIYKFIILSALNIVHGPLKFGSRFEYSPLPALVQSLLLGLTGERVRFHPVLSKMANIHQGHNNKVNFKVITIPELIFLSPDLNLK